MNRNAWAAEQERESALGVLFSDLKRSAERSVMLEGHSNIWKKVWRRMDMLPVITEERASNDVYQLIRDHLDQKRPLRALEAEAGIGNIGFRLAREFLESEVTLVDHSQIACEAMLYVKEECGLPNLVIKQADAHSLPFDDATFDAVIMHLAFNRADDPEVLAREVARVLRPGGTFYLVRARMHHPLRWLARAARALQAQESWRGGAMTDSAEKNGGLHLEKRTHCVPAFWLLAADPKNGSLRRLGRGIRVLGKRADVKTKGAFSKVFGGLELSIYRRSA